MSEPRETLNHGLRLNMSPRVIYKLFISPFMFHRGPVVPITSCTKTVGLGEGESRGDQSRRRPCPGSVGSEYVCYVANVVFVERGKGSESRTGLPLR